MTDRDRPKGTELDHLVMWVIGTLADAEVYTSTIQEYVSIKTGRWEIDHNDHSFCNMIDKSIERLKRSGVIERDEFGHGWKLTAIP